MGDPVFDYFAKGQMQFVTNQAEIAIPAGIALLDKIGSPVILLTHSQGGGIGFNVADERPQADRRHGGDRTGRSADRHRRYGQGGLYARESRLLGADADAYEIRSAVHSPADIKVHLEPSERPGDEVGCYMQDEPVHKLVGYQNMPILSISAEGTYHRVFDVCIPKWLNQAGAKDDFVRLEDVGIKGNMHEMFLDRNSQDVIKFIDGWVNKNVK